jgi:hypothetical protein
VFHGLLTDLNLIRDLTLRNDRISTIRSSGRRTWCDIILREEHLTFCSECDVKESYFLKESKLGICCGNSLWQR